MSCRVPVFVRGKSPGSKGSDGQYLNMAVPVAYGGEVITGVNLALPLGPMLRQTFAVAFHNFRRTIPVVPPAAETRETTANGRPSSSRTLDRVKFHPRPSILAGLANHQAFAMKLCRQKLLKQSNMKFDCSMRAQIHASCYFSSSPRIAQSNQSGNIRGPLRPVEKPSVVSLTVFEELTILRGHRDTLFFKFAVMNTKQIALGFCHEHYRGFMSSQAPTLCQDRFHSSRCRFPQNGSAISPSLRHVRNVNERANQLRKKICRDTREGHVFHIANSGDLG